MDISGVVLGSLIVVGAVVALLLFVLLKGAAEKDLDSISGAPRYVVVTYEFFVKAAWVHVIKSIVIFIGGGFIVLSSLPGVPESIRLVTSPVTLMVVLALMLTIGTMENGARQESKEAFHEAREGGEE